ncbi:iron complex outermembrane receptor protein [Methylovirgula ligni]|uniref:Iron complex outermembrane receptor protein n=1 Tax=Methylovirgula ligni TaxID=569860 RepID=A0A3D9YTV2_9HYPH|nr:TonB-dependent receptor [Methylovirgula ligni]REF86016.1 iron complex outermembrane receptor protein [Methylovirgula ligni]
MGSALASSLALLASGPVLAQGATGAATPGAASTKHHAGKHPAATASRKTPTSAFRATAPAPTAASSTQVSDVVVVARDRAEKAQNVPLPISVVGGKTADREHIDRLQDFTEKVPNFLVFAENPRVSLVTIRGVGGTPSTDGAESGVGVIVDGVFLTHIGFVWLDYVDLQDVEVVRGPQGTLLGKNTTVGAVIVNTQLPSFARQTSIETTVGNYGHAQVKINTTGPISDTLAYRVTFYGDRTNGYTENLYNGEGILNSNRFGVRGQLLWTPTAQFSDRLIVEHYQTHEINNYSPPAVDPAGNWTKLLEGVFHYTPSFNIWGPADQDTLGAANQRIEGISNTINWQVLGDHELTAISAWRQLHFVPQNDGDASPFPIWSGPAFDVGVNQYSQEIRLASPTNQKLQYTLGFYGLREQVWSTNNEDFYQDAAEFFGPALVGVPAYETHPGLYTLNGSYTQAGKAFTTSLAGFGQATYHVTDKFDITGGFRDTQEWKDGSDALAYNGTGTLGVPLAGALGGLGYVSGSQANNAIGWLFNPSYKFNEHILTYFSVAQGEKSGAINTAANGKTIPLFVGPEHATDFELGTKTNWFDNRVQFNVNLYWSEIRDFQGTALISTGATATAALTNIPLVRERGVEVEGRASPIENLWITYSGDFNDARYVSYSNAPAPIETGLSSIDLSGKQIIGAPRYSVQGGLYYEHPLGPAFSTLGYRQGITGFAWVNENWRSTVNVANYSVYTWQHGFALTNLGIGFHTDDNIFSAQLWARNLLDYRYVVAYAPGTVLSPYQAYLGDPRTFGLTLKTVF